MNRKLRLRKANKPAALDHVLYEFTMLVNSYAALYASWSEHPEIATMINNAWLEAFAIHARNLNEFFGERASYESYMVPKDFIPEWKSTYVYNGPMNSRASEEIAHLTYYRQRPEEKTQWNYTGIFEAFRIPMLEFLTAVHKSEPLMGYSSNRARATDLLKVIPTIPTLPEIPDDSPVPTGPIAKGERVGPRANVIVEVVRSVRT